MTPPHGPCRDVAGVILCGGLSRRMGGQDKGQMSWDGQTLLQRVVARFAPQQNETLLAVGHHTWAIHEAAGLTRVADRRPGSRGPLAGLEAAWLVTSRNWLVTVPVDLPLLPLDLTWHLWSGRDGERPVVAVAGGRRHGVVALWPRTLADAVSAALDREEHGVAALLQRLNAREVVFPDPVDGEPDPFYNVNRPEDLARLQAWPG
ncbi:MAG: molybdenum cofactor guanylyltransferase [Magnetococcus sp. WYHC-3]